jgi:hypothetical protein
VGRFLSPDPILQVVNQYAYALGNPVLFQDPDGRQVEISPRLEFALATIFFAFTIVGLFTLSTLSPGWIVVIATVDFAYGGFEWANATARLIRSEEDKDAASQSLATLDGCSPTRLTAVPEVGRGFWALLGLQLLLAVFVLRRRKRGIGGAEGS